MRPPKKLPSVIRDLALFIGIIVLIISVYCINRINTLQSQLITKQLAIQAEQIEKYFISNTQYLGGILWFMGRQIRQHSSKNPADLAYIDQLFQAFSADPNIQDILSATIIGWVNTDYQATVDGLYRVMKEPKNLSSRDYLPETAKHPWVIKLGQPIIGSTSGKWIIPAGVGITDNRGKWIGSLVIGLQQSFLQAHFKKILGDNRVNVALIDLAGQILVEAPTHFISNNFRIADKIHLIMPVAANSSEIEKKNHFSYTGYFGWGTNYYYYKIPNYDYVIFLSLNNPFSFRAAAGLFVKNSPEISIVFLLLIAGIIFLRVRVTQPIAALSDTAVAISTGMTDIAIPTQRNKEAGNLAHALEKVKKLIHNEQIFKRELTLAHEQIKFSNESLEQRVTERTEQLEEALAAKSEFLRNISHEIRSPMVGIITTADILAHDWSRLTDEERLTYAQEGFKNSQRLFSLVSNLLDLSKMDMGRMSYEMKPGCDVVKLVREMVEECRALLSSADKIEFRVETSHEPLIVTMDEIRITQVLRNLYTNAMKFTKEGNITAIITLHHAENDISMVRVSLKDEGIGIPEEECEHIFELFIQSSRTKTRAGGTGLGLSIAKQIIEAHHGRIWVENNKGKGTTFTFEIPVCQPNDEQNKVAIKGRLETPVTLKQQRILLIDDERNCLMGLKLYLTACGHEVVEMEGSYAGLDYLKTNYPYIDMVFLDLMMPGMDGLEVMQEMQKLPYLRTIPVVLQTGCSDQAELDKAKALGAIYILNKPYQRLHVAEAVLMAVQKESIQ